MLTSLTFSNYCFQAITFYLSICDCIQNRQKENQPIFSKYVLHCLDKMRNCFVPSCDAFCKKNGILKRMMFSAPKDNFESWKRRLFNKREFRETDRVCERHFDKTQILTHWEHIIDGKGILIIRKCVINYVNNLNKIYS